MGYTHYWTAKNVNENQWKDFRNVCIILHKNLSDVVICGGLGEDKPEFTNSVIWFNGDGSKGLDHETFLIERNGDDWSFCKTNRKPYDILVCAILIAANEILKYEISSDGDLQDWKPAIEFYLNSIYSEIPNGDDLQIILPKFLYDEYIKIT